MLTIGLVIAGAVFCGVTAGAFFAFTHDLPQIRALESFRPSAVTRIHAADDVLLAELYAQRRDPVALETIPANLKIAIIATEDRNFYNHSGVVLKGILRAALKNVLARKYAEGASTITQQLAKTLFLSRKKTLVRKIKEAILAIQLERRYTKNEILELYLNQVYFGSGAYGVQSAAHIYFGKHVKDLNLAECALIAAMPRLPSRYSPLVNKPLARKRRDIVLKIMHRTGLITDTQYTQTRQAPIVLAPQSRRVGRAPYFIDYIKAVLEKEIGSDTLYKGGLTIHTTLDFKLQQAAEEAVTNGLVALEARMHRQGIAQPPPECALVALDVESGAILAMVGGRNYTQSPFNRATDARRQPGSAFKPLVYAYAVEQGFAQNMLLLDAPVVFKGGQDGKDWKPENFSRRFQGEMTMRRALTHSENIPAVRLLDKLGVTSLINFSTQLGIESALKPNLSLALGTSEVNLLELTRAYTVFANMGQRPTPFGVMEVNDRENRIIQRVSVKKQLAMSRVGAAIVTNLLEGVIQEGTGAKARQLRRSLAGKTGTTNSYRDALFVGYSPTIAAGVWVGRDNFESLGDKETGSRAALPIWIEFMTHALNREKQHYFDIPDGVLKVGIDPFTGRPAQTDSRGTVTALFKKGTQPIP